MYSLGYVAAIADDAPGVSLFPGSSTYVNIEQSKYDIDDYMCMTFIITYMCVYTHETHNVERGIL